MKRYIAGLALIAPMLAHAHWDSAYYYGSSSPGTTVSPQWMKELQDTQRVLQVSIPGTHDSASRFGGWYVATQTLSIPQQLQAGIRFLDIRLRSIGGSLAVHHGAVYQHMMFGDVLNQVKSFLTANPSEFVLMRVKEDYSSDPRFGDVVDTYVNSPSYRSYFWRGISVPTVGEARGKIVMVRDYLGGSTAMPQAGIHYNTLDSQDAWQVNTNWDLYGKWEKVRAQLDRSQVGYRDGVINWLSGAGIAFPYFVASGHSSPETSAPRLATGLTTPGWSWKWKDFPRVDCFIGICTIAFEGTNVLTRQYLAKLKKNTDPIPEALVQGQKCIANSVANNAYVGIIVADFPGPGLIERVVMANRLTPLKACSPEGETDTDVTMSTVATAGTVTTSASGTWAASTGVDPVQAGGQATDTGTISAAGSAWGSASLPAAPR